MGKNDSKSQTMKIVINAYQVTEKVVKSGGNSGRVYLPVKWKGKRVKILLLEPLDE